MSLIQNCPENIFHLIAEASEKENIDPTIPLAISCHESGWNPNAFRFEKGWYEKHALSMGCKQLKDYNPSAGGFCSYETERMAISSSWGLFQMMGILLREKGFKGAFLSEFCSDSLLAVNYAIPHISNILLDCKGDIKRAISDYNDGNPRKYNNVSYVDNVLKIYGQLKGEIK